MSIQNGKVFKPAWPEPTRPTPVSTNAMLQAKYGTRSNRVDKICINMSTSYRLVIGKCTDYLWSCI